LLHLGLLSDLLVVALILVNVLLALTSFVKLLPFLVFVALVFFNMVLILSTRSKTISHLLVVRILDCAASPSTKALFPCLKKALKSIFLRCVAL